jgi:hypothetical protein
MVTSEQAARDSYGPAPTEDDDTYNPWGGLQAGALDSTHLGLKVRITDISRSSCTGQLLRVEHGANIIEERTLGMAEPELRLGNRWVHVTFGAYSSHRVNPHARVEVQRG